jgi:hypothetical protein
MRNTASTQFKSQSKTDENPSQLQTLQTFASKITSKKISYIQTNKLISLESFFY